MPRVRDSNKSRPRLRKWMPWKAQTQTPWTAQVLRIVATPDSRRTTACQGSHSLNSNYPKQWNICASQSQSILYRILRLPRHRQKPPMPHLHPRNKAPRTTLTEYLLLYSLSAHHPLAPTTLATTKSAVTPSHSDRATSRKATTSSNSMPGTT